VTASTSRDRQAHWDDRYRTIGSDNVSWYEAEPKLSLELMDLVGASPTMSIIDVGGGASNLCGALVRRGFSDVTVLDVSEEALRTAKDHVSDPDAVTWLQSDLLGWTPTRRWDIWHDRAVFHFLTGPGQRETYRRLLRDAVAPGGVAFITTFAPDGPESCSGLPVCRYEASQLLEEIDSGFTEIAHGLFVHTTPSGAPQPLTWIAARTPQADLVRPMAQ